MRRLEDVLPISRRACTFSMRRSVNILYGRRRWEIDGRVFVSGIQRAVSIGSRAGDREAL